MCQFHVHSAFKLCCKIFVQPVPGVEAAKEFHAAGVYSSKTFSELDGVETFSICLPTRDGLSKILCFAHSRLPFEYYKRDLFLFDRFNWMFR
ncbi:hypothetical protein PHET_07632 [Paragonimus heterotremus]|uniref:Uncharacterized protein n=1 Tax=Paragonimus heterotremus TaxID=100268 RepID=A0A8J4WH59_9TREM|nr:hypothetical protein PHET_07632 [Paragonimus heterotremus]